MAARTAKQKAALRKAQAASARKRRKGGSAPKKRGRVRSHIRRNRNRYIAGAAVAGYVAYRKGYLRRPSVKLKRKKKPTAVVNRGQRHQPPVWRYGY